MIRRATILGLLVAYCGGAPAPAGADPVPQDRVLALVGGRVHAGPAETAAIEDGVVLIRGGKILAVGGRQDVAIPDGARTIDVTGQWVTPGFIDASTQLGLVEISLVESSRDHSEKGKPIQPQLRVLDGFNAESKVIPVQRVNGVTAVLVTPGTNNLISGQSAVVHLDGRRPFDYLVRSPAALHASLAESSRRQENAGPRTRMGMVARLRKALVAGQEYVRKQHRFSAKLSAHRRKLGAGEATTSEAPEPPARDLGKESIGRALRREVPTILRARRSSDILLALELAREFKLQLIIDGGTEAWKVAKELAESRVPVILGPVTEQPNRMESLGATYTNAAQLHAAGVRFCISTRDTHNVRNLPYEAGFAVTYGLPWAAALEAITVRPAEILGVADQVGSLAPGRWADVVCWTGDPFQPRSVPTRVLIRGREIPLTNKQTALRDEFTK